MAILNRPSTGAEAITEEDKQLKVGSYLMTAAGVVYIIFGFFFLWRTFVDSYLEVGIGPNEVSRNKAEIEAFSDSLYNYITHLHVALAGFVVGTGMWIGGLAWMGIRKGVFFAWHLAVWPPLAALAIAMPMHYPNNFDTAKHLGMIYAASALFFTGALVSLKALITKHHNGTTVRI